MNICEHGYRSFVTRVASGWPAAAFGVLILVLAFVFIAKGMVKGDLTHFDQAILRLFKSAGNLTEPIGPAWLQEFGRDVTALGSFAFLGLVYVACLGYMLLSGKRAEAALMTASVLGGLAVSTALKMGFDRPRPDLPHAARTFTASFPSGHATLSAITFLTLGALLASITPSWRLKVYFIALAITLTTTVGVSRLYLGVHYPSDVLAGWAIGSAWALLCWTIAVQLHQIEKARPRVDDQPSQPVTSPLVGPL